jgi:FkbH-like protein
MVEEDRFVTQDSMLYWLPVDDKWRSKLNSIRASTDRARAWRDAVAVANTSLDFAQTNAADGVIGTFFRDSPPSDLAHRSVRLATLGSSTLSHLHAAIRMAGLRRGIWIETYENRYGQYLQELLDPHSGLHAFHPDAILFAFDPYHLTRGVHCGMRDPNAAVSDVQSRIEQCWSLARSAFECQIIQQSVLPVLPHVLGNNEARLASAPAHVIGQLNRWMHDAAVQRKIDLLALGSYAGIRDWHDVALWHRSKQEVSPRKAPLYGDLVGRILAAHLGRSFKCLVLDLDNTLWGGVIGEDGLEGIVLGQGSAMGEAYAAMQRYALALAGRGIILTVCSKNDEANALAPFENHPEMVLRRQHIASFIANWDDKPSNIRDIATELNVGLDSIVFLDDNPYEREIVRRELPMVAVPEVGDDPSYYPLTLDDAGYFEGLKVTKEDLERTGQYQANREREISRGSATDLDAFLSSLESELLWSHFDDVGLQRITQLVNKTNQFNLTSQRYSEEQVAAIMTDPNAFGLQIRLIDRFGDNGIIAVVIGKRSGEDILIDTWLMSCRVLGRQVELATLNVIADQAIKLGAKRLIGEYRPTPKNGIVKDHYARLGFASAETCPDGVTRSALELADFSPAAVFMTIKEKQVVDRRRGLPTSGRDF